MKKDYLYEKAHGLKTLSKEAIDELDGKKDLFLEKINKTMLSREDIHDLIGKKNIDIMKDNHSNHLLFMMAIFKEFQPKIFVDTILWVFRAYRSRGFQSTYWAAQLHSWMDIYKSELSDKSYEEIFPYYEYMLINIPSFVQISELEIPSVYPEH